MVKSTRFICILSLLIAYLSATHAFALPARPGITKFIEDDGTEVPVQIIGDEHFHYLLSTDGLLLTEQEGRLYYAVPDASGMPVASSLRVVDGTLSMVSLAGTIPTLEDTEEMIQTMRESSQPYSMHAGSVRNMGPGLKNNATFPLTGDQRALVILVEYTDVKFHVANPAGFFHNMLNQSDFSAYGGTGSVRDYYIEASSGIFRPEFDVYGPVTLPHDMAWYGRNDGGSDNANVRMMVVHACEALDSEIDFTQYDRDGDGMIDNVFLFYAGQGEADGGKSETVWPHSADVIGNYKFDGVTLQHYGCANEWVVNSDGTGKPEGIGGFCHEFAHVLGLPDLYATAYPVPMPFTPGPWSLIDVGAYNNDSRTPPALDLFSRYALGWANPTPLPADGNITLPSISDCGDGYIINTSDSNEYFLIENRQKRGWDRYVPGHGMLVWHIQFDPWAWIANNLNNEAGHQKVDIIEADDIRSEATRSGDTFPGTAGVTSLSSTTTPALKTWCGQTISIAISDIAEQPDGSVTFRTGQGATPPATPVALSATDITPRGFTAHWHPVADAREYILKVFTTDAEGRTTAANGYDGRNVGCTTDFAVTGLEPGTQYYYTVSCIGASGGSSAASEAVNVATSVLTPAYAIPSAMISEITDNGFTVNWQPVSGATDYAVSIMHRDVEAAITETESFDNASALWLSNSGYFYSAAAYVGTAAPALRLLPGEYVMSPATEGAIHSIGFWHRGRGDNGSARLLVQTYAYGCWTTAESVPLTTDKGGSTTTVNILPDDARSVRVLLSDPDGAASVYTDDFVISHSGDVSLTPIDEKRAGNMTFCQITGLEPGSDYLVTVTAIYADGTRSLPSSRIYAHTTGEAGIGLVSADISEITVNGRILEIKATGMVEIYDVAGRLIATGLADGSFTATLPAAGLYIVKCGTKILKAKIK